MILSEIKNISVLYQYIRENPGVYSIWGEYGAGKSTFCLTMARRILEQGGKVLYLSTRENIDELTARFVSDQDTFWSAFLFQTVSTFEMQLQKVFNWETMISREKTLFHTIPYQLLIVDSLTELYLLEIGSDQKNSELMKRFNFLLGTLSHLAADYGIPVIVTNTVKVQRDDLNQSSQLTQHGGSYVEYWVPIWIHLERVSTLSYRKLTITSMDDGQQNSFSSQLTSNGLL